MNIDVELDLARTLTGAPLDQVTRGLIQAVIDNPTTETWLAAAMIVLVPVAPGTLRGLTLWQLVAQIDPAFASPPPALSSLVPDQATLLAALRFATH